MQLLWLFPRGWTAEERRALHRGKAVADPLGQAVQRAGQGDPDGALARVRQAIDAGTPDAEAWHLLLAALLNLTDQPRAGGEAALTHLPYFALDRWGRAASFLLASQSFALLGNHREALRLCHLAEAETSFTSARSLRLPARLLWTTLCAQDGDHEQARARLNGARRLVRSDLDDLLWHDAAGEVHAAACDHVDSLAAYSFVLAHNPFALHETQTLAANQQVKAQMFQAAPPLERAASRRVVELHLLGDVSLTLNGRRIPTPRDARTLLLFTYLQTHNGASIRTVADLLLADPPAPRHAPKTSLEERAAARVRALVNRARILLADPACIRVEGSTLTLSGRYEWVSDLNRALGDPSFDVRRLPASLRCRWLSDLLEEDQP